MVGFPFNCFYENIQFAHKNTGNAENAKKKKKFLYLEKMEKLTLKGKCE